MRIILLILSLSVIHSLSAQDSHRYNFNKVDNKIITVNANDPFTLARQLEAIGTTDAEKVRAFFRWIAENISYKNPAVAKNRKATPVIFYDDENDTGELKTVTERVALQVLKERKARCDGYARLLKSLCDYAGIPAEIITGYARTDIYRMEARFGTNHSWNAVYYDSAWHLMDVTWASGYIATFSGEFVKAYNDYYFSPDPSDFAQHHFPDNIRWTLLSNPPAMDEFRKTPFRQRSFIKYGFERFSPSQGIITAALGDTIRFELETSAGLHRAISPDSLWDSANIYISPVTAFVRPQTNQHAAKIEYQYVADSEKIEWIYLMYNDDAVLRYRLRLKEKNWVSR